MRSKREEKEKRQEEENAKKAAELREDASKEVSKLNNDLSIIKQNINDTTAKISDAEKALDEFQQFTAFFYSLGCAYAGVLNTTQKLETDLVLKRENYSNLCAKQKAIESRINELNQILK